MQPRTVVSLQKSLNLVCQLINHFHQNGKKKIHLVKQRWSKHFVALSEQQWTSDVRSSSSSSKSVLQCDRWRTVTYHQVISLYLQIALSVVFGKVWNSVWFCFYLIIFWKLTKIPVAHRYMPHDNYLGIVSVMLNIEKCSVTQYHKIRIPIIH